MEEANLELRFGEARAAPFLLSLAPHSPMLLPSRRRLSSSFVEPSRPVSSARQVAWISLQGRLVNAEEASSAQTIGGGLTRDEALAWELFSPIQRFLIVAVIGVSVAESKKNQHILQLKKSVELRDQVLSSMQQKLDNLCEQVNNIKNDTEEHSSSVIKKSFTENGELPLDKTFGKESIKFVDCGCWLCDQHGDLFDGLMRSSVKRVSSGNEVLQYKIPFSNEEQEERRMSDLSDWASSVTSATDIQLSSWAFEQDIYNLKRDCEEKESTIKELTTLLSSSEVANSKRVAELEDIIRRKNTTITKLKKDLVTLEQKVVHLSRLGRPSFSASGGELLHTRDNLLYDMDSTTSPSSSDSDTTPINRAQDSATKVVDVLVQNQGSPSASDLLVELRAYLHTRDGLSKDEVAVKYAGELCQLQIAMESCSIETTNLKRPWTFTHR
ncbi:hypothetical protein L6164_019265 [Bauhinia variegata]|uniref:Uncharacterized protein n=1 Tax=Bauhinia variegata TaxID=167791 RepID=A0ACB9NFU4_BAUVA|nr:hypothetical protein L6164_019265 [Bauhinia variegata]